MSKIPEVPDKKQVVFSKPTSVRSNQRISIPNDMPPPKPVVRVPVLQHPSRKISVHQLSSGTTKIPPFCDASDMSMMDKQALNSPLTPVSLLPYDLSKQIKEIKAMQSLAGNASPQLFTSFLASPLTPVGLGGNGEGNISTGSTTTNTSSTTSSSVNPTLINIGLPSHNQSFGRGPLSPPSVQEIIARTTTAKHQQQHQQRMIPNNQGVQHQQMQGPRRRTGFTPDESLLNMGFSQPTTNQSSHNRQSTSSSRQRSGFSPQGQFNFAPRARAKKKNKRKLPVQHMREFDIERARRKALEKRTRSEEKKRKKKMLQMMMMQQQQQQQQQQGGHRQEKKRRGRPPKRKKKKRKKRKKKGRRRKRKKSAGDDIKFLIKPARKPLSCYLPNIPPKAYSHPYKYDISVHVPVSLGERSVGFRLTATKSGDFVDFNHKKKKSIKYEKKTTEDGDNGQFEVHSFRVVFQVCSFHFQRSTFQLGVYILPAGTETLDYDAMKKLSPVFVSDPFEMFARKNKKSDKEWPNENEVRTMFKKMEREHEKKRKLKLAALEDSSDDESSDSDEMDMEEDESPVSIPDEIKRRPKVVQQHRQQQYSSIQEQQEQQQQQFRVPHSRNYLYQQRPRYSQNFSQTSDQDSQHSQQRVIYNGSKLYKNNNNDLPKEKIAMMSSSQYPLRKRRHARKMGMYAESPLTPKSPTSSANNTPATPTPREETLTMPMPIESSEEEEEEVRRNITGVKRKRPNLPKLKTDLKRIKRGHVVDKGALMKPKHNTV